MSGTLLLIAGPSGSGKTTLTRALVNRVPLLTRAITVTTRLPRPGEVSGEDYHFVSPERFSEMNRAGALIECAETYTESYGIPRTVLAGLCDRALILTAGGALALRQRISNSISIFIQPSSAAAAAARIVERNCPNSQSRIAGYQQEVAASSQFNRVFLNEDFDKTLDQIEDFYLSARRQRPHGRPAHKFDNGTSGYCRANSGRTTQHNVFGYNTQRDTIIRCDVMSVRACRRATGLLSGCSTANENSGRHCDCFCFAVFDASG